MDEPIVDIERIRQEAKKELFNDIDKFALNFNIEDYDKVKNKHLGNKYGGRKSIVMVWQILSIYIVVMSMIILPILVYTN